ncbi:MAG: HAD family hydrolase [Faecousia sp.]
MKLKGIIFDFDGTLFDSMYIWDTAGETYLRALGKTPQPSLREAVKTMSLRQSACYLREEYALEFSVEEIIQGINQTIEHFYLYEVQPKAGVLDFLKTLAEKGISMSIATATDRYQIQAALQRCGMDGLFSAIFTCSEVGRGKDEPLIYRKAMDSLGTDRGNTIIFEDAYHAALTAKSDGFLTAGVFDPSENRQEALRDLCDCYLSDFTHTEPFWKLASAL